MDERTAFKILINDIVERTVVKSDEGRSYIEYHDQPVSTVRVMGVVVSKYESDRYTIITIDDSTETLSIRAFAEDKALLDTVREGDTVDVIGSIREYEDEPYLAPRIVKMVDDPNWEVVRTLELQIRSKKLSLLSDGETPLEVERVTEDEVKTRVLMLIDKLDSVDGADYNELLKESKLEDSILDQALNELLKDSDIYEPKIGKFRKV